MSPRLPETWASKDVCCLVEQLLGQAQQGVGDVAQVKMLSHVTVALVLSLQVSPQPQTGLSPRKGAVPR